jgi:hypothetical protein
MHAKIINGEVIAYPYGPGEILKDNPNTSFTWPMSEAVMASFDVYPVEPRNPPAHDYMSENCERVNPTLEEGKWIETWSVTPASEEQTAQRHQELSSSVRAERNARLAACDWTVLADAPLDEAQKAAWMAYRQALRDLTAAEGFPGAVIWPVSPAQE